MKVGGDLNTKNGLVSNTSEAFFGKDNGPNRYSKRVSADFILGAGYEKEITTDKKNGEVTNTKEEYTVSAGYPGVGALEHALIDENGKKGYRAGYTNEISVGAWWNVSFKFSLGVKINQKQDDK